ncbi:MAG: hypothetical protein WA840_04895 [Caulobacteraceae bacterium]
MAKRRPVRDWIRPTSALALAAWLAAAPTAFAATHVPAWGAWLSADKMVMIAFAAILLLFFHQMWRRGRAVATGMDGMARIEKVSITGTYSNSQPIIRFDCIVTPADGVPYKAAIKNVVRLNAPASMVGKSLAVKIDRKNRKSVYFADNNL